MFFSQRKSFSLMALSLALLPLQGRADATFEQTCSKIEKMLVSVQLAQPNFEEDKYNELNDSLLEAHTQFCDSSGTESLAQDAIAKIPESLIYEDGASIERDGHWYLPDGSEFIEPDAFDDSLFADAIGGGARIMGPFMSAHRSCASGCGYKSMGVWGDRAHQKRRSCHNSGEAIDVGGITCGGRYYGALSGRFDSYVSCMRRSMGAIYRSKNHYDHAHIQIQGCNMCRGLRCSGGSGRSSVIGSGGGKKYKKGKGYSKKKKRYYKSKKRRGKRSRRHFQDAAYVVGSEQFSEQYESHQCTMEEDEESHEHDLGDEDSTQEK